MKRGMFLLAVVFFIFIFSFNVHASLLAHYDFNGDADDSEYMGGWNHGVLVGGMNCDAPGIDGTACDFSGDSDYIEVVNGILDEGYTGYTISGWIKQDINNIIDARQIIRQGEDFSANEDDDRGLIAQLYYGHPDPPARLFFYQAVDGNMQTTNTNYDFPHDDEWHHVAFSYEYENEISTTKLYIDGDLKTTRVEEGHGPPNYPFPDDSFYFGKKRNTDGFAGLMDEFRIYDHLLNDDQVKELYHEFRCTVPEGGMIISEDTAFCRGNYLINEPILIQDFSEDVTLDCRWAQLTYMPSDMNDYNTAIGIFGGSDHNQLVGEYVVDNTNTVLEVMDNQDLSGGDLVGTWTTSTSSAGYYGEDYLHDEWPAGGDKSATYDLGLTDYVTYSVYMHYPAHEWYATNTPVDVHHSGGVDTHSINQEINGGYWNFLGDYEFDASNHEIVIRNNGANGYVIADAFGYQPIDAGDPLVRVVGDWSVIDCGGQQGDTCLRDRNSGKGEKYVEYSIPDFSEPREYDVYVWDFGPSNAYLYSDNVPIEIYHAGGVSTFYMDQSDYSPRWKHLGRYTFDEGNHKVRITNEGTEGYVYADAFRFDTVRRVEVKRCNIRLDSEADTFFSGGIYVGYPNTVITRNYLTSVSDEALWGAALIKNEDTGVYYPIGAIETTVRDNYLDCNNEFGLNGINQNPGFFLNDYRIEGNYIKNCAKGIYGVRYNNVVEGNRICGNTETDLDCGFAVRGQIGLDNNMDSVNSPGKCFDVRGKTCGETHITSDECVASGGSVMDGCGPGYVPYNGGVQVYEEPLSSPGRVMGIPAVSEGGSTSEGEPPAPLVQSQLDYCLQADFNEDHMVDVADFGAFASCYHKFAVGNCTKADFNDNGDYVIDITDFSVFASVYNLCNYQDWYVGDCCVPYDYEAQCSDGVDNDLDGYFDNDDPDCGRDDQAGIMDFIDIPRCFDTIEGSSGPNDEYGGYVQLCGPRASEMSGYDETPYTDGDSVLEPGEACNIKVLRSPGDVQPYFMHTLMNEDCELQNPTAWDVIGLGGIPEFINHEEDPEYLSWQYTNDPAYATSCYDLNEAYYLFADYAGPMMLGSPEDTEWAYDWAGALHSSNPAGASWHDGGYAGDKLLCAYCGDEFLSRHETNVLSEASTGPEGEPYYCNDPEFKVIEDPDGDSDEWDVHMMKCYCPSDIAPVPNDGICSVGETDTEYYGDLEDVIPGETGNGCEIEGIFDNMCRYGKCVNGFCEEDYKNSAYEDDFCFRGSEYGAYCNGDTGYCEGEIVDCGNGPPPGIGEDCDCGLPWECDPVDLNHMTCEDYLGSAGGDLGCFSPDELPSLVCTYDISNCWTDYHYHRAQEYHVPYRRDGDIFHPDSAIWYAAGSGTFELDEDMALNELIIGADLADHHIGGQEIGVKIDGFGTFYKLFGQSDPDSQYVTHHDYLVNFDCLSQDNCEGLPNPLLAESGGVPVEHTIEFFHTRGFYGNEGYWIKIKDTWLAGGPPETTGIPPMCHETDGGHDIYTFGMTFDEYDSYDDECYDSTSLYEYYCGQGGYTEVELVTCPIGCTAGECTA